MANKPGELTWTLKMSPDQAQAWEALVVELADEAGRVQVGRAKLTRKELVETLVGLAQTDKVVRKSLVKALGGEG
jgi:hypothetical protein